MWTGEWHWFKFYKKMMTTQEVANRYHELMLANKREQIVGELFIEKD